MQALDAAIAETRAGADEGAILAAMQGAVFAGGGDYPGNPFIIGSGRRCAALPLQVRPPPARRQRPADARVRRRLAPVPQLPDAHARWSARRARASLRCTTPAARRSRPPRRSSPRARRWARSSTPRPRCSTPTAWPPHRFNACGYSLGTVYAPCWMDWPMFFHANPVPVAPGMVLFLHMILMDSDAGLAMTLGRTSLITEHGPEPLSTRPLDLDRLLSAAVALPRAVPARPAARPAGHLLSLTAGSEPATPCDPRGVAFARLAC